MEKREIVFFGIPTCPYCKKRVNLIRTWSLKRQGEYQCPRCGGISNIYLSPLIYVFALLAVFAGGAVYFFHKFVLDDVELSTVLQVFFPFGIFFLLSLFMVYLSKPIIKKVPRAEADRKRRRENTAEDRRRASADRMFQDDQEYLPKGEYLTGPIPREDDGDMKVIPAGPARPTRPTQERPPQKPFKVDLSKAEQLTEDRQPRRTVSTEPQKRASESRRSAVSAGTGQETRRPAQGASQPAQRPRTEVSQRPAARTAAQAAAVQRPTAEQPARPAVRPAAEQAARPVAEPAAQMTFEPVQQTIAPIAPEPAPETILQPAAPQSAARAEVPSIASNEDFFAKYNDPDYVERRLRELQEGRQEKSE